MSVNLTNLLQKIQGILTLPPNAGKEVGVVVQDTATVTWAADGFGNLQATAVGGATLPTATASGQVLTATGAGTNYTAQVPNISLIGTYTPSNNVASYTISSIPQTFKHLLLISTVVPSTAVSDLLTAQVNSDTTLADYYVSGTNVPFGGPSGIFGGFTFSGLVLGAAQGQSQATIFNYSTNANISAVSTATGGGSLGYMTSGSIYGGSQGPITSLTLAISTLTAAAGPNFATGTFFELYGIS